MVIDFGFTVFRTFQHRSSATTIAVHYDMPKYEKNKLILALRELNLTADAVGTPSGKFGSYMRNQQSRFRYPPWSSSIDPIREELHRDRCMTLLLELSDAGHGDDHARREDGD